MVLVDPIDGAGRRRVSAGNPNHVRPAGQLCGWTFESVAEADPGLRFGGARERLYVAPGGFLGMNGNDRAGVLEGRARHLRCTGDGLGGEPFDG
jgi:hypothetical protein